MAVFDIVGSTATDSLSQAMALAQERHNILADNIANIDTPGYRMKDIDVPKFQATLAKAISKSRQINPNAPRLDDIKEGATDPSFFSSANNLVFHDDNNRSVEELMVEITKNAANSSQYTNLMRNQFGLLRNVISETV